MDKTLYKEKGRWQDRRFCDTGQDGKQGYFNRGNKITAAKKQENGCIYLSVDGGGGQIDTTLKKQFNFN